MWSHHLHLLPVQKPPSARLQIHTGWVSFSETYLLFWCDIFLSETAYLRRKKCLRNLRTWLNGEMSFYITNGWKIQILNEILLRHTNIFFFRINNALINCSQLRIRIMNFDVVEFKCTIFPLILTIHIIKSIYCVLCPGIAGLFTVFSSFVFSTVVVQFLGKELTGLKYESHLSLKFTMSSVSWVCL